MTSYLFGTKRSVLSYTSAELAFSAVPNDEAPGKAPAHAYFTGVLEAVTEIREVAIEIAAEAETRPTPVDPRTLQELVQAGRTRLQRERARKDRDAWGLTVAHVSLLEERLRP